MSVDGTQRRLWWTTQAEEFCKCLIPVCTNSIQFALHSPNSEFKNCDNMSAIFLGAPPFKSSTCADKIQKFANNRFLGHDMICGFGRCCALEPYHLIYACRRLWLIDRQMLRIQLRLSVKLSQSKITQRLMQPLAPSSRCILESVYCFQHPQGLSCGIEGFESRNTAKNFDILWG